MTPILDDELMGEVQPKIEPSPAGAWIRRRVGWFVTGIGYSLPAGLYYVYFTEGMEPGSLLHDLGLVLYCFVMSWCMITTGRSWRQGRVADGS